MEQIANVYKFPNSFFVLTSNVTAKEVCEQLCKENTKWETKTEWEKDPFSGKSRRVEKTTGTEYATRSKCGTRFGFLISEFPRFLALIRGLGINEKRFKFIEPADFVPDKVEIKLKPFVKPREHQVPAIEFIEDPVNEKLAVMQAATGFGKTVVGIISAAKRGVRVVFSMEPGHIKTWVNSIKEFTDIEDDDIFHLQGSHNINKAIELRTKGEFNYKIILASASTLRAFNKNFEELGIDGDKVIKSPLTLWQFLGVGYLIRDEAHEATHALIRQTIYSTVAKQLCLSATLVSDDKFITQQYAKVFPIKHRWLSKQNKHLTMHSLLYSSRGKINCRGFGGYSAVKYEQSIMKNKGMMDRYLSLIGYVMKLYDSEHKPGKKAMVMVSTLKFVDIVVDYLKKEFPKYTVDKYVGGSPKSNLYEPDIVIGTVKSLGVGIDLPNLSMCLLTTALGSTQLSTQIAGRPRPIKLYPDDDPRFVYFVNTANPAQVGYHVKRQKYMANKIKRYSEIQTYFSI